MVEICNKHVGLHLYNYRLRSSQKGAHMSNQNTAVLTGKVWGKSKTPVSEFSGGKTPVYYVLFERWSHAVF